MMPRTAMLTDLALFPLSTVLFPGGVLALQVFEVRYLEMVQACRAHDRPFGVVALARGSEVRRAGQAPEELHAVGTLAVIEHYDTPRPGLILLGCRGTQRFRVRDPRCTKAGLWIAEGELLANDQPVPIPPDLAHTSARLADVLARLRQRHPSAPDPTPAELADCGWVANRWCELLPASITDKQRLMALDNPLVRLELVADLLGGPHAWPQPT